MLYIGGIGSLETDWRGGSCAQGELLVVICIIHHFIIILLLGAAFTLIQFLCCRHIVFEAHISIFSLLIKFTLCEELFSFVYGSVWVQTSFPF